MGASVITSGTAVASTSGTSVTFTSIPSWVKRITVMFNGVSTSGTSLLQIQIGSGSVDTTGYLSIASSSTSTAYSSGFVISQNQTAALVRMGSIVLVNVSSNNWVASGILGDTTASYVTTQSTGTKTTASTLDRIRLTTVNGTDTFDAGSVNILYE